MPLDRSGLRTYIARRHPTIAAPLSDEAAATFTAGIEAVCHRRDRTEPSTVDDLRAAIEREYHRIRGAIR